MPSYGFTTQGKSTVTHKDARAGSHGDIEWLIRQALYHGDRKRARDLYFLYMIPDSTFSDNEVERIGYQVGAVDVGDLYVASRSDL